MFNIQFQYRWNDTLVSVFQDMHLMLATFVNYMNAFESVWTRPTPAQLVQNAVAPGQGYSGFYTDRTNTAVTSIVTYRYRQWKTRRKHGRISSPQMLRIAEL